MDASCVGNESAPSIAPRRGVDGAKWTGKYQHFTPIDNAPSPCDADSLFL